MQLKSHTLLLVVTSGMGCTWDVTIGIFHITLAVVVQVAGSCGNGFSRIATSCRFEMCVSKGNEWNSFSWSLLRNMSTLTHTERDKLGLIVSWNE